MFIPLQDFELQAFYLWLRGRTEYPNSDDLALVFILCPEERPKLIREFVETYHAYSRLKAFNQYFSRLRL